MMTANITGEEAYNARMRTREKVQDTRNNRKSFALSSSMLYMNAYEALVADASN